MTHSLSEVEDDAMQLSEEDRARLAVRLLASLEEEVGSPEEIERIWVAEAERRFVELRDGVVQGIPASEVFAQLRSKLSSRWRSSSTRQRGRSSMRRSGSMKHDLEGLAHASQRRSRK